jgi:hypothetical protein
MMVIPTMATKWTSAIVSRFWALNIAPATTSYPAAAIVHASVNSRSYTSDSNPLSHDELEKKKQEVRIRRTDQRRLRYQSDPAFREKLIQSQKQKYATDQEHRERRKRHMNERYATDSKYREQRSQYAKEKWATDEYRERMTQIRKKRLATDPQFSERQAQLRNNQWKKVKSELEQDPEAYKLVRHAKNEKIKAIYRQNAEYRWGQVLGVRLRISDRLRNEIIWKSHEPVKYATKEDHTCATCNRKRFGGGAKFW